MCRDNSYHAKQPQHIDRWLLQEWEREWLKEQYGDRSILFEPIFHQMANFGDWPIIVPTKAGYRATVMMHWGLIPFWTKTKADGLKAANSMVNARVETIHEKAAYKNLVYSRRCIVPSTGFFEHHHFFRGKKDIAQAFYIKLKDEPIFGMAGLYTQWVDKETGEVINSFTIITTAANETMERIHNAGDNNHRMPLILEKDMEEDWLNPNTDKKRIDEILAYRAPSECLDYWPVASVRARNKKEGEAILERIQVPEIDWA